MVRCLMAGTTPVESRWRSHWWVPVQISLERPFVFKRDCWLVEAWYRAGRPEPYKWTLQRREWLDGRVPGVCHGNAGTCRQYGTQPICGTITVPGAKPAVRVGRSGRAAVGSGSNVPHRCQRGPSPIGTPNPAGGAKGPPGLSG
jgi:hypothetical protein